MGERVLQVTYFFCDSFYSLTLTHSNDPLTEKEGFGLPHIYITRIKDNGTNELQLHRSEKNYNANIKVSYWDKILSDLLY